jgi:hypothetical protein
VSIAATESLTQWIILPQLGELCATEPRATTFAIHDEDNAAIAAPAQEHGCQQSPHPKPALARRPSVNGAQEASLAQEQLDNEGNNWTNRFLPRNHLITACFFPGSPRGSHRSKTLPQRFFQKVTPVRREMFL